MAAQQIKPLREFVKRTTEKTASASNATGTQRQAKNDADHQERFIAVAIGPVYTGPVANMHIGVPLGVTTHA